MSAGPPLLHASPFSDDFLDVPELNEDASRGLLARLDAVRAASSEGERVPSTALTVLGPAGGGKTHLLARIRHVAGPKATPVLLRPYFGVSLGLRDVLAATIDQMCRPPKGAIISQLDLVASYWLGSERRSSFPAAMAEETREMPSEARTKIVEIAVARVVERVPELAPVAHLVRAVLGMSTLKDAALWSELAWLSGREPRSGMEGSAIGEGDVLRLLTLIATLAAPVAPIALVFDQLENLATEGDERVLGYGNLIAELVDSVPALTIVQLALTSEWLEFIEPRLSLAQRTRVAHDKVILSLPNEAERRLLLRAWRARLIPAAPSKKKRGARDPLREEGVAELLAAPGMTPRMLFAAYARLVSGEAPLVADSPVPPRSSSTRVDITSLFAAECKRVDEEIVEKEAARLPVDATALTEGVAAALHRADEVEIVTRAERERMLGFVRGRGNAETELVVVCLTAMHHLSVAAGLTRAAELARTNKVVVIREKRFDLPATWSSVEDRRAEFERLPNARWIWLSREDTIRCLALARLESLARAKRLRVDDTEEPIPLSAFAELTPAEWPAIAAIARARIDVPRERTLPTDDAPRSKRSRSKERDAEPVGTQNAPMSSPVDPVEQARTPPEPAIPPSDHPLAALRGWAREGRALGRATITHYLAKLRARSRS